MQYVYIDKNCITFRILSKFFNFQQIEKIVLLDINMSLLIIYHLATVKYYSILHK